MFSHYWLLFAVTFDLILFDVSFSFVCLCFLLLFMYFAYYVFVVFFGFHPLPWP